MCVCVCVCVCVFRCSSCMIVLPWGEFAEPIIQYHPCASFNITLVRISHGLILLLTKHGG